MPVLSSRDLGDGIVAELHKSINDVYVVLVTYNDGKEKKLMSAASFGQDLEAAQEDLASWRAA